MKTITPCIGKCAERTAIAVAATGLVALSLAGTASADEQLLHDGYIEVANCQAPGVGDGQFCPGPFSPRSIPGFMVYPKAGSVKVEFTANPNHCSDMIAHLFYNDTSTGEHGAEEWGSNIASPGGTDGGYEIPVGGGPSGVFFGVKAEGVPGGCNTGSVSAWGGRLRVYQLT